MDKILVVEDDKTVYSGIKKLLELQHYSVVIAQNGMEALEKIYESFSLVIMDIMMRLRKRCDELLHANAAPDT